MGIDESQGVGIVYTIFLVRYVSHTRTMNTLIHADVVTFSYSDDFTSLNGVVRLASR